MNITSIADKPIQTRDGNTDSDILRQARDRATVANTAWQDTFDSAEDDELFIAGVQWSKDALQQREEEDRPSLVINQLQQYISRVAGAQKKQVQEIKISPTESSSKKEPTIQTVGGNDIQLSKVLEGVVRNIQSISNAPAQYKTAYRHALGGIGWLRVLTEYSRQDSFDLDAKIEAISNRWSVLMDPYAKESDYSDANYCFISERMSKEEFRKRYPNGTIGELGSESDTDIWWGDEKTITVSEYFRREPAKRTILLLSSGETVYKDEAEDVLDELAEEGITVQRERVVDTYKVIWSKITANSILEKDREFPTSTIPVVPVLGKEVNIRGKRTYQGLITNAKDSQRMLNYWQSAATERIGLAPKAPFIAEVGAVQGRMEWATANTKNWSILTYNKGFQQPRREAPPAMPIAEMNMAQNMQASIQSSIGIYDASIGKQGNETSGRAILARQSEADTGTFEFVDNLANAMRRIGILLVEIIPRVYDTERILRIKNPDGSGDFVEINKVIKDKETGKEVVINDLALGKYDVTITTGSSYATKRMETADSMLQFAQAVPQAANVAADLIAENMDFNNSDALSERLKKTLPSNLLSMEEQEEIDKNTPKPEAPPPSPEQIKAQSDMEMKQLDMQMKQSEQAFQLEMEQIKLQTAELNLRSKEVDAGQKIKEANEEEDEIIKDNMAKEIANKIKNGNTPQQA